ncbi:RAD55 family ATPase [Halodesulfurarchaeum formicicum]|nr:transcriptional regulator [Halodesulfurarchaeum formicicum]
MSREPTVQGMAEKLSTGVEVLDRELAGGLPAGSVVAYQAPAASQGELLLYELTRPRETLYLTTIRTEDAVADAIAAAKAPTGEPKIELVTGEDPIDSTRRAVRNAFEGMTVIIDPIDPLERADRARYEQLLNEIRNHMINTGGIAFLHALEGPNPPAHRETTQHMADVVLDLDVDRKGSEIDSRLTVQKYRGGKIPSESIKLDLTERVRVDTSRDIA